MLFSRFLIPAACVVLALVVADSQPATVKTIDLCGQWEFAYTTSRTATIPISDNFKASMPVPGCWDDSLTQVQAKALWPDAQFNPDYVELQIPVAADFGNAPDASLPYLLGSGWYRKRLEIPAEWQGRQVTLNVGRVVMEAWLYVNGREVHHHLGHSTPWEVSLAPHLKFGESNEIVIAVDNTRTDRLGCVIRGWKGRSAGIFGPVSIKVAGTARIAEAFVYPEGERLVWSVDLQGRSGDGAELQWKISDPRSGKLFGKGSRPVQGNELRWGTGTLGIPCWSDEEPNLAEIELKLVRGDRCLDVHRQAFGMRRLTRDGIGLRLNGHPIYLRGVCDSAYFPETCTPPLDLEWYRNHIRRLKEIGFNWVRFHTWTPPEPYLQAADELGMLVQVEPPRGYQMDEWRDIVRCCRKHPSVVIYCCGNEEMLDEPRIEFLRRCAEELRRAAPDALFNPQEAMRGIEYVLGNVDRNQLVQTPFPHHPKRLAIVREFSDVFGQYALGWVSYCTLQGHHVALDRRLAVYQRPCLAHELGIIGCYLDLKLEDRYNGTRIGTDLFVKVRESLAKAGLLDRAERYHRNSAAWQRLICKDVCEMARKCRLIAGYDMLGAHDIHWHRSGYGCGVMNEFDKLKVGRTVEDVLRYNGPSVLLIGRQRERNLRAGQTFSRELLVSWFGRDTLKDATAQWTLKATDGSVLGRGQQTVAPVASGEVKKIAEISVDLPKLERPVKATLIVELSGAGCKIDNRWDYWIFPNASSATPSNVTVTDTLNTATLKALARGGRVVLFGHKPFPARSMGFQMGLAGRPEGNLATVIADHPLTERFPHDGYCDWQFAAMLTKATPVLFDKLEVAFDPIVEVVNSYKRPRKQAAVFEWRVGDGRLLVCTLRLPKSDPAAAYIRNCLLDYAAGDQFQPGTTVILEQLAEMVKLELPKLEEQQKTDEAFDARGQLSSPKKQ